MFIKEIRLNRIDRRSIAWNRDKGWGPEVEIPITSLGIIRCSHYGSNLSWFIKAATIAKEDFPFLTDEDIEIVKYGGKNSGTFGIEFKLPDMETAPEGYSEVYNVERTTT
jgi:hypothetical protein